LNLYRNNHNIEPAAGRKRRWVRLSIFAIGLLLAVFAARELWIGVRDDAAARKEYVQLRELSAGEETTPAMGIFSGVLAEINPDFVGWIFIPGTTINYPVVRGEDNLRYVNAMFSGAPNPAGAIFMDYRCAKGFNAPVSLIYGHNMRNGSMFSPLNKYTDKKFLDNHPEIIIFTADGEKLVYSVIDARRTNAMNSVYSLDFKDVEAAVNYAASAGVRRLLVLSTCIGPEDSVERLLVFAGLKS